MTISKDNKWMILSLLKLKDNELFPYGILEHSNPLLNSKGKDIRIIKCRKVKFGAYQDGRSVFLSFDWTFCKLP